MRNIFIKVIISVWYEGFFNQNDFAKECFECGSECYCNGHIDDCIVSKTPPNCDSCGCVDWFSEEDDYVIGEDLEEEFHD